MTKKNSKYTLKNLERDLKKGTVTVKYADPLKSYINVYRKGVHIANFCVPGSLMPTMADFFLAQIKKSKSLSDRRECARALQKICHYRWDHNFI